METYTLEDGYIFKNPIKAGDFKIYRHVECRHYRHVDL